MNCYLLQLRKKYKYFKFVVKIIVVYVYPTSGLGWRFVIPWSCQGSPDLTVGERQNRVLTPPIGVGIESLPHLGRSGFKLFELFMKILDVEVKGFILKIHLEGVFQRRQVQHPFFRSVLSIWYPA